MVAINDRVKETTTTTGQGTVDLGGAKTGFETFVERIGNGNQTYYCIAAEGGAEFEVGIGTVTSGTPDTLSRDTVLSNSDNNTNKVTFSAGTKEVFCTLPASKAILEDSANNMNVAGSIVVGGTVDGVDIATRDGVLTATTTTANAALPKAGGTMTGDISHASNFTLDIGGNIRLDADDNGEVRLLDGGTQYGALKVDNSRLKIQGIVSDADMMFAVNDGGSEITALTLDASEQGNAIFNKNAVFADNGKALFGDSTDLIIYHDGNDSYISEEGTGTLIIRGSTAVRITNVGGDNMFQGTDGGAAELYHAGTKKAETTSSGLTVTGTLSATTLSGAISGNISQLTNNSGYITQVTSGGATTVSAGNGIGLNTGNGTITMSGSFSGSFSATSNITAYSSDERLKDFKGKIDNALDKVDQLNGYYFEWNDVAKNLDGGKSFKEGVEVGVSAQEIEKVLPEVVTEAPIVKIENLDVDYKTVYYDKIVPLLIEAIKELRAEVKKLKEDK
jgi:hypothetical protein